MAQNSLEAAHMAQQRAMVDLKRKTYSTYYREEVKVRYIEKLAMLDNVDDPYIKARQSTVTDWQQWPEVEYPDIFNYLVAASICKINSKHTFLC